MVPILDGEGPQAEVSIHFVTDEQEHVDFFRDAIEVERAGRVAFEAIAPSAFPSLAWADGVFGGLKDFSRNFISIRGDVSHHLSVLNDHAVDIFSMYLDSGNTSRIESELSALGVTASDENGDTKRNTARKKDRTRTYQGEEQVFWWHTKLQPHIDRIYFRYFPKESEQQAHIAIGIFKDHCE